jgi:uncharacterized membrane protein (Fun14 family)
VGDETQGILAQLGVGGALVVVVAYAMITIFRLFIEHWNKQETERTEAYKASAKAHADSLNRVGDAMERMSTNLGDKVIAAFASTTASLGALTEAIGDLKVSVGRLEGKFDTILDATERPLSEPARRAPRPRTDATDRDR